MKHICCLISLATLIASVSTRVQADTVKLAGSISVINLVINPYRASVEKLTGHTVEVVESGSGKGLVDLANNKADAACGLT